MKKTILLISILTLGIFINHFYSQKHKKYKHSHVLEQRSRRPIYINKLPNNHRTIIHKKNNYHYNNGNYYIFNHNQYRLTYPIRGLRIQHLPIGYKTLVIGQSNRYYYNGIFYSPAGNEFEVIDPPLGAIVPEIPLESSTAILIEGKSFYRYNSILFEPVDTTEGVQYRVIEKYE